MLILYLIMIFDRKQKNSIKNCTTTKKYFMLKYISFLKLIVTTLKTFKILKWCQFSGWRIIVSKSDGVIIGHQKTKHLKCNFTHYKIINSKYITGQKMQNNKCLKKRGRCLQHLGPGSILRLDTKSDKIDLIKLQTFALWNTLLRERKR